MLFGIFALQNDFISKNALIQAMNTWVLDKEKPLGTILLEQKALTPGHHALLSALMEAQLKKHDKDAEKSLAAVSSVDSVREELKEIADPDVQASLIPVSANRQRMNILTNVRSH